jgi:protein SCO1/2
MLTSATPAPRRRSSGGLARVARLCVVTAVAATFACVDAAAQDRRPGADRFPNVTFTTQDGRAVRFYDDLIKGKTVAIDLIYTTCQYACPLETAKLAQVQRLLGDRMGRDIFFYSITIDPEHDTPAVLKEYADRYQAGPGWLFLTGRKEDIELVSRKLGMYTKPDLERNPDGHMPFLLVGNEATGQWMRNSALDNPGFVARTIGDWLNSWQNAPREPLKSYAEVSRLKMTRGQYTFATHCSACHTVGGGERIGPDLQGVTATRDRAWLTRFITEPEKMRAEGDPIAVALRARYKQARMPNLDLTAPDAAAIVDYLAEESRAVATAASTAPAKAAPPSAAQRSAAQRSAARPLPPAAVQAAAGGAMDLRPVVNPYLRIQRALHTDTTDGIALEARAVAAAAGKLGSGGQAIQAAAVSLQGVPDVKAARAGFAALSDAIIVYARNRRAGIGDEVKVAYCPMARKYWLQEGEKVQNPFYGKAMAECGRITPELPDLAQ